MTWERYRMLMLSPSYLRTSSSTLSLESIKTWITLERRDTDRTEYRTGNQVFTVTLTGQCSCSQLYNNDKHTRSLKAGKQERTHLKMTYYIMSLLWHHLLYALWFQADREFLGSHELPVVQKRKQETGEDRKRRDRREWNGYSVFLQICFPALV